METILDRQFCGDPFPTGRTTPRMRSACPASWWRPAFLPKSRIKTFKTSFTMRRVKTRTGSVRVRVQLGFEPPNKPEHGSKKITAEALCWIFFVICLFVGCFVCLLVGFCWLVGLLVVGWLVGLLVGWFVGVFCCLFVCWLFGLLVCCWLVGWLFCWGFLLVGWLVYLLVVINPVCVWLES